MAWSPPASKWDPPSGAPGEGGGGGGGGGGGSSEVTLLDTWDATSDLTTLTITGAGTSTLYAADGSTARATIVVTKVGNLAAGWSLVCNASATPPIYLTGVEWTGSAGGGYVNVQIEPVFASSPAWTQDRWLVNVLFAGISLDGTSAANSEMIRMGCAPKGKIIAETGSVDVGAIDQGSATEWWRETWDDSDSDTAAYAVAPAASISMLVDYLRMRVAIDNGGTSYASDLTSTGPWDLDTIGQGQIPSGDDTAVGSYSTGLGITMHAYTKHTGDGAKIGLSGMKLYVGAPVE